MDTYYNCYKLVLCTILTLTFLTQINAQRASTLPPENDGGGGNQLVCSWNDDKLTVYLSNILGYDIYPSQINLSYRTSPDHVWFKYITTHQINPYKVLAYEYDDSCGDDDEESIEISSPPKDESEETDPENKVYDLTCYNYRSYDITLPNNIGFYSEYEPDIQFRANVYFDYTDANGQSQSTNVQLVMEFLEIQDIPEGGPGSTQPRLSIGFEENKTESISNMKASPNPTQNQLNISFDLENDADVEIGMFDLTGRRVMAVATEKFKEGSHVLETSLESLDVGVYYLSLRTDVGIVTRKIVKL